MTGPAITPIRVGDPAALLEPLRRALSGQAPIHPYADGPAQVPPHERADLPAGLALVVGTSGSTGAPKLSLLTAAALRASAEGTERVLGGPGRWQLALPPTHIAGLQVLTRSLVAGTDPVLPDRGPGSAAGGPFTAAGFAAAAARLGGKARGPAYTSLVPTQVVRLLDDPDGTEALRRFSAVLVGGAGTPPALRARAEAAGVRLIATYGTSETAGGCVYDGDPLPGVRVAVEDNGRIFLGGPTLASGYLGPVAESGFVERDDERWFATDDLGELTAEGHLRVLGRRDDVIVTGGRKVHPRVVEEAVAAAYPQLTTVVAIGLPDPEWGQAVALAVAGPNAPSLAEVREGLRGVLPAYALPRRLRTGEIPERGPGKPDRRALWEMGEWQA